MGCEFGVLGVRTVGYLEQESKGLAIRNYLGSKQV